jgi:hypothetical protein
VDIPLSEAPEHFFDQLKWHAFIAHFDAPSIALARISNPPSYYGFYREDDTRLPMSNQAREQKTQEAFELGISLVGDFRGKLINNRIVATGVVIGSPNRALIAPEQWQKLWPNFIEDKAMGPLFEISNIQLSRNDNRQTRDAEMLERCITYLQQRKGHGESQRKILEPETNRYFGNDLTTRVFNEAYKKVFNKKRGRPREKE